MKRKKTINIILIVVFIILVISPIDLVPDVIPIAGLADDAGYIIAGIVNVVSLARKIRDEKE